MSRPVAWSLENVRVGRVSENADLAVLAAPYDHRTVKDETTVRGMDDGGRILIDVLTAKDAAELVIATRVVEPLVG
mgnify:CR=1 FL=1